MVVRVTEEMAFWLTLGIGIGFFIGMVGMFFICRDHSDIKKPNLALSPELIAECDRLREKYTPSRFDVVDPSHRGKVKGPASNDFAVNGPPRRKPWVVRKRELEEAARTKRKKLESFSEYV